MNLQRINLSNLVSSEHPRPLVTQEVDKLAASIKEIGLIQPITVISKTIMRGLPEPGWKIVAGHHRVAACRALGWTEIDALVIDDVSYLQSELIEIDENLCRAELTKSQRTKHTKRRAEIWEAMHPAPKPDAAADSNRQRVASLADDESAINLVTAQAEPLQESEQTKKKHGGVRSNQLTQGFAASTASATGQSKAATNRALAIAKVLTDDDLDKINGTSLDSDVEMTALTKLPAPERAALVERAAAGEKVSARHPDAPAKPSKAPSHISPMRLYKAVHDMVHGLGFPDVKSLIEAIAELTDLTAAEKATLGDVRDVFVSIGEAVPSASKV